MAWDPGQYLKFAQPRLRPARDLLARIHLERPASIFDLGCGTGNVTRLLAERWPGAHITGVDNSAEMLTHSAESSSVRWVQADLNDWRPSEPADLIFSNSALHWLPNHRELVPALFDAVAPGGVLAVQMPRNFLAPSHTEIHAAARAGSWRDTLEHLIGPPPVAEPQYYYSLLCGASSSLDIWETEYLHVLEGQDAVKEWTKGTWLKRFLDALEEPQRSEFETEYARRVAAAYPQQPDGKTLFPFRRLFIVAVKSR
jgi:trans-aconitate 2-methyltransferase